MRWKQREWIWDFLQLQFYFQRGHCRVYLRFCAIWREFTSVGDLPCIRLINCEAIDAGKCFEISQNPSLLFWRTLFSSISHSPTAYTQDCMEMCLFKTGSDKKSRWLWRTLVCPLVTFCILCHGRFKILPPKLTSFNEKNFPMRDFWKTWSHNSSSGSTTHNYKIIFNVWSRSSLQKWDDKNDFVRCFGIERS